MDISIIIVNYNSINMVIDCINSIFEKTKNVTYEIIVVDNASQNNIEQVLRKEFGNNVKIVLSNKNLGFGKANNLGASYAKGKYLFLLNPDTILINNAIKKLYDYLKSNPKVGVAGGNLYTPELLPTPSHCLIFDDLKTEYDKSTWHNIIKEKIVQKIHMKKKGILNKKVFNYSGYVQKVAYVFGADMMLSKELFDELNGFDSDFFMYAEEQELSWRISRKGYDIVNVPDAKIIHLEGATVKEQNKFSERQFKMRMHGTLTYFKKRFGITGVKEFYNLRSRRYSRLIKMAKLQHKLNNSFVPLIQKQCLDEVFQDFLKK